MELPIISRQLYYNGLYSPQFSLFLGALPEIMYKIFTEVEAADWLFVERLFLRKNGEKSCRCLRWIWRKRFAEEGKHRHRGRYSITVINFTHIEYSVIDFYTAAVLRHEKRS